MPRVPYSAATNNAVVDVPLLGSKCPEVTFKWVCVEFVEDHFISRQLWERIWLGDCTVTFLHSNYA